MCPARGCRRGGRVRGTVADDPLPGLLSSAGIAMYRLTALLTTAWILAAPRGAAADVVFLKSGGRVQAQLVEEAPEEGFLLVRTPAGALLKLATSQVDRIERKTEAERQYEALVAEMEDTAEAHLAMAQWCREHRLSKQRELHLRQVLKHDPDNEEARHGLGYSRVDGRWVRMDEWMTSQGYVRYKGTWRLRQEVALQQEAERRELAEKKWLKDLKRWRGWIGSERQREALAQLRAVKDPMAVMGLTELLKDETIPELKLLYIELLGRLNTGSAQMALAVTAVEDDSQRIREACLDELEKEKNPQVVRYLIEMLDPRRNPSVSKINRAGIALGRLGAKEAIKPMIDALVTEHKIVPPKSPAGAMTLNPTFSSNGSGGLTMGGRPKVIKRKVRNEGVLYGLKALTGQDFRFDQDAWRQWLVRSHTPADLRLRRDE